VGDEEEEEEEEVVVVVRCRRVTEGGRRGGALRGRAAARRHVVVLRGTPTIGRSGLWIWAGCGCHDERRQASNWNPGADGGRMDLGSICCVRKWRRKASMEIVGTAVGG